MARLPAAVAASTCSAWNWPGLQMATTSTSGSSSRVCTTGGRPRPGPARHQCAHFGVDIHNMHDLQPIAKGREGGKMNGLGDGTRSDYADSKWLAHSVRQRR